MAGQKCNVFGWMDPKYIDFGLWQAKNAMYLVGWIPKEAQVGRTQIAEKNSAK